MGCRSATTTLALGAALLAGVAHAADWELIGEKDGISTYLRPVAGEPIQAARGVMTVDVPACQLISFYVDPKLATTWVDMLVEYKMVELEPRRSLVWQRYDMPWPVSDRDFLLDVSVTQPNPRTIKVSLVSTTDPRFPPPAEDADIVRGRMSPSSWTFTRISDTTTKVDMVGHVDPSGNFPAWLVNLIQHNFPYNTLSSFVREARLGKVALRSECADW